MKCVVENIHSTSSSAKSILLTFCMRLVPLLACGGEDCKVSLYLWQDKEVSSFVFCIHCTYLLCVLHVLHVLHVLYVLCGLYNIIYVLYLLCLLSL